MSPRAALLAIALAAFGCGGAPREPAHSTAAADDTGWVRDIVDTSHDLTVSLRPKKLAHDPVYGPLIRKASQAAAGESRALYLGSTTLQALEQSDEVLLAIRSSDPLDAVLIVSGVPSGIDPEKVLDDAGRSPWRASARTSNGLLALQSRESDPTGVLYVVGERTWVLGIGAATDRVRERLVREGQPSPRPPASLLPHTPTSTDPPLAIRLQGELLERLRSAARRGLGPIFDHLEDVRMVLAPGDEGSLLATLDYEEEQSAERARGRAAELMTVLPEKISPRLGFLRSATVRRSGRSVQITAKLPAEVLKSFAQINKEPTSQAESTARDRSDQAAPPGVRVHE